MQFEIRGEIRLQAANDAGDRVRAVERIARRALPINLERGRAPQREKRLPVIAAPPASIFVEPEQPRSQFVGDDAEAGILVEQFAQPFHGRVRAEQVTHPWPLRFWPAILVPLVPCPGIVRVPVVRELTLELFPGFGLQPGDRLVDKIDRGGLGAPRFGNDGDEQTGVFNPASLRRNPKAFPDQRPHHGE